MQLFDISMFILSRTVRRCQYLINTAFLSFFWGCQKSALIAVLKTPAGSARNRLWHLLTSALDVNNYGVEAIAM